MYFLTTDKSECTGCTACKSACPKNCIAIKQDEEGFLYPIIDKAKCINCGLCEKVCPVESPDYKNDERPGVYAAFLKDSHQRTKSSSGGIFYAIAKWIIYNGGIVYGAAFDENFKLIHKGVDTIEALDSLRGSKYLQSDLRDSFTEIKTWLQKDRLVYFVGTGCEVAGLKAFLHKDYPTLFTSDLICHGVPSQLMFDYHLAYLREKEKAEILWYTFRDNKKWGACEIYKFLSDNKERTRYNGGYYLSPYLYSFIKGYTYRYSCYQCKFARTPRQGDITLGDFWGVRKAFPDIDFSKGVSLLLVNNKKGRDLWNTIRRDLTWRQSELSVATAENGNIIHPTVMPTIRTEIYSMVRNQGYKSVAENEFKTPHYWRHKIFNYIRRTAICSVLRKARQIILVRSR